MTKSRHTGLELDERDLALGLQPLTARSLLASMLLGTYPPRLPVRVLVAAADLFDISQGAARTALSRMMAAGDVVANEGWYELGPTLSERQRQQDVGRQATRLDWDGTWHTLIVTADRRSAAERTTTRARLIEARYAEVREGVWVRPANLPEDPFVAALPTERWLVGHLRATHPLDGAELWPLDQWQTTSRGLGEAVRDLTPALEAGDRHRLARGFVLAAAILRHFRADPLLPDELLPDDWLGPALRRHYDRFDVAYRELLRQFFRSAP